MAKISSSSEKSFASLVTDAGNKLAQMQALVDSGKPVGSDLTTQLGHIANNLAAVDLDNAVSIHAFLSRMLDIPKSVQEQRTAIFAVLNDPRWRALNAKK